MCSGKAALTSRFEFPLQFACASINSVKVAIEAAEKNETFRYGGRRGNPASSLKFPFERTSAGVERIEKVIAAADVQHATGDRWRR